MSGEKMKLNKWRLPLLVGAAVVLAGAIAVGIGVLIAHDQRPTASPAGFTPSAASPSAAALQAGDPHARKACELNKTAYDQEKLHDVPTVQAIFDEADQSKDFDIKLAAQHLYDGQQISNREIARGAGNLELALAVDEAAVKMMTTCTRQGLLG